MILAAAGLLLPIVAVCLALFALRLRDARDSAPLTLAISIGGGLGLASVLTFWCVSLGLPIGSRFALLDAVIWTAIGAVAVWTLRRNSADGRTSQASVAGSSPLTMDDWLVRGAFWLVAASAVATVVAHYVASPHGEWDAWAIWNLKARFLVRDTDPWTTMLAVRWSQPSHPFFVSLSVARLWGYAGSELTIVPATLGLVWGIGIVTAVMGALDTRRRRAWIAGSVLIAPATFTQLVAAQTADLAVGLFVVATLIMVRRAISGSALDSGQIRISLLLAAVLGSLGAWTKNEGVLLMLITTVILAWTMRRRQWARSMAWWVAGAVPVCLTLLWFKLAIAPVAPAYIAESPGAASLLQRLFDPARHAVVADAIGWRWLEWGGPMARGVLPLMIVAAVAAVFTRAGRAAGAVLVALGVMFAAYYAIWILSPLDTSWLVSTTFDRLLIQLWPSLVLTAFSAGAAAEPSSASPAVVAPAGARG